MKTNLKLSDKEKLVLASRAALQTPQQTDFWSEVTRLFEADERMKKELVEPRKTRTI